MLNQEPSDEPPARPGFLKHLLAIACGCAVGYLFSRFLIGEPVIMIFATVVGGFLGSGAADGHPFIRFGNNGLAGSGSDTDGGGDGGD